MQRSATRIIFPYVTYHEALRTYYACSLETLLDQTESRTVKVFLDISELSPRAKSFPSSPDHSRLAPLSLDHTRLADTKPSQEPVCRLECPSQQKKSGAKLWILYALPGVIRIHVHVSKSKAYNSPERGSTCLNVDSLVDFPDFYEKSHKATDDYNCVSLIVHNIQENYDGLEDIEEHRPNRKTFQCLATSPELDV